MIAFHRLVFGLILCIVFIKGGIDEGRKELLAQLLSGRLITMTLHQLSEIEVNS